MTSPPDLRQLSGGSAFRGTVPPEQLDQVPPEARDPNGSGRVYWQVQPADDDAFLAGAYWGLAWSLDTVFGGLIGQVLNDLTLQSVEQWTGQGWVPVA